MATPTLLGAARPQLVYGRDFNPRRVHPFRRERYRRRATLLAVDPTCDNCRCPLQNNRPEAVDYAHVTAGRLSCGRCLRIVRALAAVECEVTP